MNESIELLEKLRDQMAATSMCSSTSVADQTVAYRAKVCKFFLDQALAVWNR